MIPVPNLDDRKHREIVEEALRLIPQYCPEWTNFNPSDPGITLIELFAAMTEMVIYRLNKVTDKNFIAFLSMLGVRLQPPQPARSLLRFNLVPKANPTWVTGGTPVATVQVGKEEPVVFETTEDVLVADNRIVRCFTQVSDEYAEHTPLIDGRRSDGFEVFGGVNHIERSLYLGDPRFEQIGEDALLIIRVASDGTRNVVDLLEWEYWNGRRWRDLQRSVTEVEEGAIPFQGIDKIEVTEINGIEMPWVRGRLVEAPPTPSDTIIDSVVARVEVLGEGVALSAAYVNIDSSVFLTVDLSRAWLPFGKEPRIDNALYLLAQSLPTQPGSTVRVEIQLAEPRHRDAPQPSEDLALVWEYFNGKKWVPVGRTTPEGSVSAPELDFIDGTDAFTGSGDIRFRRPANLAEIEVQGELGAWLRVRVECGDFGVSGQYELDGERWIWRDERPLRPPWVKSVICRYTEIDHAIERVVTYNDFAYFDHSTTARTALKSFQAFEPSTEDSPSLYLGFEKAFANEATRIYFAMTEKTSLDQDRRHSEYLAMHYAERERALASERRVVWEYWAGQDWSDLSPEDGTRAFTESGFLKFVGPEDWRPSKRFGEVQWWLRARLEMGGYHQVPRASHILLNTVFAYNHTTIRNEVLGTSDGTPNQKFRFAQGPVLEGQRLRVREREAPKEEERQSIAQAWREHTAREGGEVPDSVEDAGDNGFWVAWIEVESFFESGPRNRHYVIDRVKGEVLFGDGRKGMIPPTGTANVVAWRYRIGGGAAGNVTAGAIRGMRRSIAHIESVTNPFPAGGGSDEETVDEAKARGPHVIKSRNRAVTAEDFEWLTLQASNGIARARCIPSIGREGEVTVVVVPKRDDRRIDLESLKHKLIPSTELLRRVKHFLDERRLLTTVVHVVRPRYIEVSITVEIIRKTSGSSETLKRAVEERLRRFLDPLLGGRSGDGWPFGRNVLKLDLYNVVEEIDGVDVVHRIRLHDEDRKADVDQVKLAPDELVHLVDVSSIEKPREQFL